MEKSEEELLWERAAADTPENRESLRNSFELTHKQMGSPRYTDDTIMVGTPTVEQIKAVEADITRKIEHARKVVSEDPYKHRKALAEWIENSKKNDGLLSVHITPSYTGDFTDEQIAKEALELIKSKNGIPYQEALPEIYW